MLRNFTSGYKSCIFIELGAHLIDTAHEFLGLEQKIKR
jgi:hypothetical protein